ncbi:MAG TPA: universal stress protein [Chloroflexia bacterium]|nr:universal stress protein [Chloroflexia bacterium]
MREKLLVPLDGSLLAEQVLPLAIKLVRQLQAVLLLVRACERSEEEESLAYLDRVRKTLEDPDLLLNMKPGQVHIIARVGEPQAVVNDIAFEEKAAFIIMTTHGRSGLARLLMGSVAIGILRHSECPVLLLHLHGADKLDNLELMLADPLKALFYHDYRRIVVTLDNSPDAELVLDSAIKLARLLGAKISLLQVIIPNLPADYGYPGLGYGYDVEAEIQVRSEEVTPYLEKLAQEIRKKGLECDVVLRSDLGSAAEQIVRYLSQNQPCIVAMTTHARGTVGHLVLGSVAETVLKESDAPALLVHYPTVANL